MASFGKWGDMSAEEQAAAKKKHGSRSAWKQAKQKARVAKGKEPSIIRNTNKNKTSTSEGTGKAPSWYKNLDGTTPSTMQKGMTEEKWNKSLDTARANKAKNDAQKMANQKRRND